MRSILLVEINAIDSLFGIPSTKKTAAESRGLRGLNPACGLGRSKKSDCLIEIRVHEDS